MRKLGIILSGGQSTRLYPSTLVITKQLLPVYDKPLIYYPLSTLMLAGIQDFILITSPGEKQSFERLFKDCQRELGINMTILTQDSPRGIADAFNIVYNHLQEKVYEYDQHALILGDNIFYGSGLSGMLVDPVLNNPYEFATVFAYPVKNPEVFGVVELKNGLPVSLEEKPTNPKSNLAVTGLYFYPTSVYHYVRMMQPSPRGELEITDVNKLYLTQQQLQVMQFPRGMVWFDTGTPNSMLEAANFVQTIQQHQNYMVGCPHEIGLKKGWTTKELLQPFIDKCLKTDYGKYLENL